MGKHTPGPWEAEIDRGRTKLGYRRNPRIWFSGKDYHIEGHPTGGSWIAEVGDSNRTEFLWETIKADARLIAAAPDLLEALKDVVALARRGMVLNGTDEEFANIRLADAIAAIAKAEGR